ncbi:ribose-phosphate pyrophosphokinase-like domain-containing protein [Nocardia sp. NPDC001965]
MTSIRISSGSANPAPAARVADLLDARTAECGLDRLPDGEIRPAVARVHGTDVYIVQPTAPPVNDNLIRVAAEAIASAGADRLVVIDPHTSTLEAISPIPVER